MMKKLLFVEDDENLSSLVIENMEDLGFEVNHVVTGEEALALLQKQTVDLVLMDVELLGKLNGFETAEKIRSTNATLPILFVTARKEGVDLKRGLAIKYSDYVRKPYTNKEIAFRIKSLIGFENKMDSRLSVGKFSFDPMIRRLCINSLEYRLTNMESTLLTLLIENEHKIVCKDFLIHSLWSDNNDPKSKEGSLQNLISNLRKYLKEDPALILEVVSKCGYRITTLIS
jgi:DNA-binding response OmpR family regulator